MKAYWLTFISRLTGLVRRRRMERSMTEEMQAHLDVLTEDNIAAGMSPEEARFAAQRRFGGRDQIQEKCRDERGLVWLETLGKDLRFAVRSLVRTPGFTVAVVVTLAVGIGATTAIVSIARRVVFPSIPYPEPDRLVIVTNPDPTGHQSRSPYPFFSFPYRLVGLRESASSFATLGAQRQEFLNLVIAGDPAGVSVEWVTAGFFSTLDASAELGRLFLPDEYRGESGDVAVLSWQAWQKRFNGNPRIIGQDVLLGGRSSRVVGVLPKGFTLPPQFNPADVYLPNALSPTPEFSTKWLQVVGRLKPGVTLEQARSEMAVIHYPAAGPLNDAVLVRLRPQLVSLTAYYETSTTRLFWVFIGAVGLLYFIACSNAVSLMLTRLVGRRRELGVRLAMGCSQRRIVRLLLAETLVLALAGGGVGIVIAWLSCAAMTPLLPFDAIFFGGLPRVDHWMLLIALGLSVITCLLVGIVPAWPIRRMRLSEALAEGAGTLGGSRRLQRLRGGLVVFQAALAAVLLVGTGLTLQSYIRLGHVDFGFDLTDKLAVAGMLPEGVSPNVYLQLATRVRDELARLPGVRNTTFSQGVPLSVFRSIWNGIKIDGRPELGEVVFSYNRVSPEYFATLGLPILAGRGFEGLKPGDPPVMVINQTAAHRYFAGRDAIGRRIEMEQFGKWEIIGVVGDVRENGHRGEVEPQFYMPFWQPPINPSGFTVLIRMAAPPVAGFEPMVRRAAYSVEPHLVVQLDRLANVARADLQTERYSMVVLEVLAALALTLAALGLFAVMAYSVAQRQREFGVRVALGARPGDLARLILGHGLRMVAFGVVLGLGLAWGLARFLQSVLFETSPTDPATFAGVAAVLVVAALAACWWPARRAGRVDVARLLRAE